ncbi:single-stranded DNA-binding protein [Brevibacillus reuszeri]|uniref:single-stranded DNA-binding protein n=1 Tax=Brevibacillus reuszeri TaxID=54915 RepID=UPI000CCBE851|nr:single-stranded DNA-binding protein [Brevibacillus reuszeri]
MSIRDQLKKREEERSAPKGNGLNDGLPEGVTRYVRLGAELKDGRQFAMLADPDNWFFYYCHEDGDFATRATYVRKHTCLHSPKQVGASFTAYQKPSGGACISCKAKAKRKLYFMIPVFDLEYMTWRVLDVKEFHANNLIGDYDKLEKAAKKFNKEYSIVGDVIKIGKTSDGKSYSLESGDADVPAEAAQFVGFAFPYEELANFREEDDIIALLNEADPDHIDKSVLPGETTQSKTQSNDNVTPIDDDGPLDIADSDLPF